jgi:hypothetical protein
MDILCSGYRGEVRVQHHRMKEVPWGSDANSKVVRCRHDFLRWRSHASEASVRRQAA